MSVRCFASSEPRTPPSNLGQEDELLLNGQHQLHRGEDGLNPGQHHHKEGEDQACHGELLHLQGQEHNISGLFHHHQREDQDRPGWRLVQQRHHHHVFSESHLPQTQDALDERGPHRGVGGLAEIVTREQHHHREHMDATTASAQGLFRLTAKTGLNLLLELWFFFFWLYRIYQGNRFAASTATPLLQSRMTAWELLARVKATKTVLFCFFFVFF